MSSLSVNKIIICAIEHVQYNVYIFYIFIHMYKIYVDIK